LVTRIKYTFHVPNLMYKVHAPRAELNVQKYTFHLPNLMYKVHVPCAELNP
jgi:hypothetical protein